MFHVSTPMPPAWQCLRRLSGVNYLAGLNSPK
jgi:hypothetical protein